MPSFRASAQKEIYGIKKHQRNSCGISLRDSNITDFPESRGLTEMGIVSRRLTSAQLAFYHAREREEEASWPSTTQTKATAIVYTSVYVWAHDIILRFPSPPLPRLRNERTSGLERRERTERDRASFSAHPSPSSLSLIYSIAWQRDSYSGPFPPRSFPLALALEFHVLLVSFFLAIAALTKTAFATHGKNRKVLAPRFQCPVHTRLPEAKGEGSSDDFI